MPIQVNEIVFKATIQDNKDGQASGSGGTDTMTEEAKKRILKECIEQMLEISKNKKER